MKRRSGSGRSDAAAPHPSPSHHRLRASLLAAVSLALLDPRGRHALLKPTRAYVTSGLPAHTHRAFLNRLTDDLCAASPGTLAPREVSEASALLSAWATDAPDGTSGRQRAMAAEGLLKRMVDKRRAGNAGAIAQTVQYNAVMKSWATSGEGRAGAMRVEQVRPMEN